MSTTVSFWALVHYQNQ